MKNLLQKGLVLILALALTVMSLPGGIHFGKETKVSAELPSVTTPATSYQGGDNWYYYGGKIGELSLVNMIYEKESNSWVGQETGNRIYVADKRQQATKNEDAIRAYVISAEGLLDILGSVAIKSSEYTESAVVSVVLAKEGNLASADTLWTVELKGNGTKSVNLGTVEKLRGISVEISDALLFVVAVSESAQADAKAVAVFEPDLKFRTVNSTGTPQNHITSKTIESVGDYISDVDAGGSDLYTNREVALQLHVGDNNEGPLQYVFRKKGEQSLELGGYKEGSNGFYARPTDINNATSVGVLNYYDFLSNPNVADFGVVYTAPVAGKLNIGGIINTASNSKQHPDITANYDVIRISEDGAYEEILNDGEVSNSIDKNEFTKLAQVSQIQNIDVNAGDRIAIIAEANNVWRYVMLAPIFDYIGAPKDMGITASESIPGTTDFPYNYLDTAITYQGEGNWYNYGRSTSDNTLVNMVYSRGDSLWQGQEEFNRVYQGDLTQVATFNYDAVRAYVVSATGTLQIGGEVSYRTMDNAAGSAKVSVVKVKQCDLAQTEEIWNDTVSPSYPTVKFEKISPLKYIDVEIGDAILLVVSIPAGAGGGQLVGAIFKAEMRFTDIQEQGAPEKALEASSISNTGFFATEFKAGDVEMFSNANAAIQLHVGDNTEGPLQFVYQNKGTETLNVAAAESGNGYYEKPDSQKAVRALVYYKLLSNPSDANMGFRYNIPLDGKISIKGVAVSASDTTHHGEANCSFDVVRIHNGEWTKIVENSPIINAAEANQMTQLGNIEEIQNISVEAGDQIALIVKSESVWRYIEIAPIFDYVGNPQKVELQKYAESQQAAPYDYMETAITYQGQNDWYNYGGKVEENNLYNMVYTSGNMLWQGREENNRIYMEKLTQVATANNDSIRAYVISANGKMNVAGTVEYQTIEVGSGVGAASAEAKVYLAPQGNIFGLSPVWSGTVGSATALSIDLSKIDELKGLSVSAGDVLLLAISLPEGESKPTGAIFKAELQFTQIDSLEVPVNNIQAADIGTTGYFGTEFSSGNRVSGGYTAVMAAGDNSSHLRYVYKKVGTDEIVTATKTEAEGNPYEMPNSSSSVRVVWSYQFYANPGSGYGEMGMAYYVPASGKLTIDGAYKTIYEGAHVYIEKVSDGEGNILKDIALTANEAGYFADVEEAKEIEVQAGDVVAVMVKTAAAWNSVFVPMTFNFVADPVKADLTEYEEPSEEPDLPDMGYLKDVTYYQGQGNWYNYGGKVQDGELVNMIYSVEFDVWNGQDENARIYNGDLTQSASRTSDSIRAYVISKTGKMTLKGGVQVRLLEIPGRADSVAVRVVIARDGDLSQCEELFARVLSVDNTELTPYGVDFSLVDEVKDVEVGVNDVLLLIASMPDEDAESVAAAAIFMPEIEFTDITVSEVPENKINSHSLRAEGWFEGGYDNSGNNFNNAGAGVPFQMHVGDNTGNIQFVFKPYGTRNITTAQLNSLETGEYIMPNTDFSVRVVWWYKFYANPNSAQYGDFGVQYTAAEDGVLNIGGLLASSNVDELGDRQADGRGYVYLVRIRNGVYSQLVGNHEVPCGSYEKFSEINGYSNISVQAGDRIAVMYTTNTPWKVSCLTPLFDFMGKPVNINVGWQVSDDIDQETYDSVCGEAQGENNWYYAYGDSEGEYYEMDYSNHRWTGTDVYGTATIDNHEMQPSNSASAMKIYKAVGNGTARIVGNAVASFSNNDKLILRVLKRAYNGEGWDEAEELFKKELSSANAFTEFNITDKALSNGDLIIVEVSSTGEDVAIANHNVLTLNAYVKFVVSEEAEEVEGIGAAEYTFDTDWYSGEQGKNGWFYAYGTYDNYVLMDYGFGTVDHERWFGPEWNVAIEKNACFLGAYTGSIRIYVVDRDGTLAIKGTACMLTTDGTTGVHGEIYHNGTSVWSNDHESNDYSSYTVDLTLEVKKGDVIMFCAENIKGDVVAYATQYQYQLALSMHATGDDVASPEELASYLSPKASFAEYLGIYAGDGTENVENPNQPAGGTAGCGGCNSAAGGGMGLIALAMLASAQTIIKKRREK